MLSPGFLNKTFAIKDVARELHKRLELDAPNEQHTSRAVELIVAMVFEEWFSKLNMMNFSIFPANKEGILIPGLHNPAGWVVSAFWEEEAVGEGMGHLAMRPSVCVHMDETYLSSSTINLVFSVQNLTGRPRIYSKPWGPVTVIPGLNTDEPGRAALVILNAIRHMPVRKIYG